MAIEAATCGEALNVVDDLLSEDESVDYSATQPKTLNTQVQVHQAKKLQLSDTEDTSNSLPDSATDSSLDTSSIEIIQASPEGLEI